MDNLKGNLTSVRLSMAKDNSSNGTSVVLYGGIVWCVAFGIESLAILFSNLLTIAAFATKNSLRKRGTYLLINLATADIFIGLVAVPLFIYFIGLLFQLWTTAVHYQGVLNSVYYALDILLGIASLGNLTIIALERLYAALRPFRYRTLRPTTYYTTIAITWTVAFIIASFCFSAQYFTNNLIVSTYVSMIVVFIAFVVICSSYAIVWLKLKLHRKQDDHYRKASENERKIGITMIILTALSLATWLPFVILNLVVVFTGIRFPNQTTILATKLLHYGNSLVNCLVYTLRMPHFRRAVMKLLGSKRYDYGASSPIGESSLSPSHYLRRNTFSNCSMPPPSHFEKRRDSRVDKAGRTLILCGNYGPISVNSRS